MGAKVGKVVGIFFAGCYLFFFICFIDAFLGLSLCIFKDLSYLCIRKTALGKLKASFLCARLHFFCSDKYNIYIFVNMRTGDKVLISPDLTHAKDWTQGEVIEVENNPFVGIVISAKTADGNIFFGYKDLFEPAKDDE